MIASENADALRTLRLAAPFAPVSEQLLEAVAGRLTPVHIDAGATILREGESGDCAYLLSEGEAAVVSDDLIGQEVPLAVFGPGAMFGEAALLTSQPRTATVRAVTTVRAYRLSRADFEWLADRYPELQACISSYLDRLQIDGFLKRASPFARLPADVIWRLAGEVEPRHAVRGETLIREGQDADLLYLLRSGRVEVIRGGKRATVLEAGDFFGEVGLLAAVRRTATVRALDDCELLTLARPTFQAIVREHASLERQFREIVRIRYQPAFSQPLSVPDPVATLMPFLEASRRQRYWKLLIAGVLLSACVTVLALWTGQLPIIYAAMIVGALVGPVAYVTYLAERNLLVDRPWPLVTTFALAAGLATPVAVTLERSLGAVPGDLMPALLVGLIEEPAKALGVLWILRRKAYRFRMDGVIHGAAAGMGFAALETMLFALARLQSVDETMLVLWLRSVLSPFSHGAWTALICAAIWREKGAHSPRASWKVGAAFGTAILLHGFWDWRPLPGVLNVVWLVVLVAVGILLLRTVIQQAVAEEQASVLALNPEVDPFLPARSAIRCRLCGQPAPPRARYCPRCGVALKREAPIGIRSGRDPRRLSVPHRDPATGAARSVEDDP